MAMLTEIRRKLPLMKPHPSTDATPLSTATAEPPDKAQAVLELPVEAIIPNRNQPRSTFNHNAIQRLADSIRRYGILQPLTVRKVLLPATATHPERGEAVYELVAGERRLRASKLAELTTVPCIVINTDDATSAELAIVENLLRENLNMFEQAEAFERLIREFHLTQDEAARRVSMSQSAVANKLRILRLLPEVRQKILQSGLTERHARALLKVTEPSLRGEVLERIIEKKMNVSATETYIDKLLTDIARFRTAEETKLAQRLTETAAQNAPTLTACPTSALIEETPQKRDETPTQAAVAPAEAAPRAAEPSERAVFAPTVAETSPIAHIVTPAAPDFEATDRPRSRARVNDLQVFYNSIQNAVNILKTLGIDGKIDKQESDGAVTVTIQLTRNEP